MALKLPLGRQPWPTRGRKPDSTRAPLKYVPPLSIELKQEYERQPEGPEQKLSLETSANTRVQ